MLLYLLRGSLPWQGLKPTLARPKDELVLEMKRSMTTKELCADIPQEFAFYFDHVRALAPAAQPNYTYVVALFSKLFRRMGFENDSVYDWTIKMFQTKGRTE